MDVGVDEAGANDLAADIILHLTGIVAHADDLSLGHGNIPMAKLIGKHIDVRGILQHKICLPAARGDFDQILLFHQLPLDPGGVGFVGIGHAQHPFVSGFCGGEFDTYYHIFYAFATGIFHKFPRPILCACTIPACRV